MDIIIITGIIVLGLDVHNIGSVADINPILTSKLLINTDSEQEGEICIGCAGGINFETTLDVNWQATDANQQAVDIALTGLSGGHSGVDIHLGRGNANKLLARLLAQLSALEFNIAALRGGSLRNAIPREAYATLMLDKQQLTTLQQLGQDYLATLKQEFGQLEPNINLTIQPGERPAQQLSKASSIQVIHWLNSAPNGVISMSQQVSGVVESSLNLGIVTLNEQGLTLTFLIRSLSESTKAQVVSLLVSHSELVGAQYSTDGDYPGWTPAPTSPLLKTVMDNYQRLFADKPKTMVIHAGLECGLFKKFYPDMDMVSFGPTIVSPHSPDERVNIKSVLRYWQLLIATIKNIE